MELNVLGLTADTEHAYTALIGMPRCTASELGAVCGLSASAAGRLLSRLVKDGLATRAAGRPPRFTATAPEVAVTALIQEREHQLDAARSLVQRLAETHREANRISHPDIAVELLIDRGDISAAVHRLTSTARREVRAFDRPPYIDRPGANLETQTQRQRTGVSHRVIYSRAAVAWPGRLHGDILPSVRGGEQARVRAELPLKLVISDDQAAIIPFSLAPGGHSAAYLIRPSPMLVSLEALFEAEWERAVPLRDAAPPRGADTAAETVTADPGPAAVQADTERRALLTMLSSGLTDAAIARTQGWSPRTTQRRIHDLMTELGASTRFQAAVMAARRGWL